MENVLFIVGECLWVIGLVVWLVCVVFTCKNWRKDRDFIHHLRKRYAQEMADCLYLSDWERESGRRHD